MLFEQKKTRQEEKEKEKEDEDEEPACDNRCNAKVSRVIVWEKPKKDVASWTNECDESANVRDGQERVNLCARARQDACEDQDTWAEIGSFLRSWKLQITER